MTATATVAATAAAMTRFDARKRQVNSEITYFPRPFIIEGGRLMSAGGQFSTSEGVAFALFTPSNNVSLLNTDFRALGYLTWTNEAIKNGQASFCRISSGDIYVLFTTKPSHDCLDLFLEVFSTPTRQS